MSTRFKVILAFFAGLMIFPFALLIYSSSGMAPVAASDPPMPFEKYFAQLGRNTRIRSEMPKQGFPSFGIADMESGVEIYRTDCAFCHGLMDQPRSDASKDMFPNPPQFFSGRQVATKDPIGENYWKVRNGIRLSGMPGFKDSLTDQQLWQVSAVVTRANVLATSIAEKLREPLNRKGLPKMLDVLRTRTFKRRPTLDIKAVIGQEHLVLHKPASGRFEFCCEQGTHCERMTAHLELIHVPIRFRSRTTIGPAVPAHQAHSLVVA